MWQVIGAVVGIGIAALGFVLNNRYRATSPSAKAGFQPHNLSPWGQLWRQRRADKGKGDNWFTRPLIRFSGGRAEVLPPKDDWKSGSNGAR